MKLYKSIISLLLLVFLGYLALPSPRFPIQPPDSVQSLEDADTESPLRRAYFTDFSREQVLEHYRQQLEYSPVFGLRMPTYRLNYPPEDAQSLIRDQTRSTFLEEIVHPFRESFFVNGFTPTLAKDDIWYKGVHYERKITVRYVPSPPLARAPVAFFGLVALFVVSRELLDAAFSLARDWFGKAK